MRIGGFVASGLIADARERKARRAKSRIERQCAFQLRDALLKGAARREQQREVRAELGIARRELDAASEQRLSRIELSESMLHHGRELQRRGIACIDGKQVLADRLGLGQPAGLHRVPSVLK